MPVSKEEVPTLDKLINPTLRALHTLGGSASIREPVDDRGGLFPLTNRREISRQRE